MKISIWIRPADEGRTTALLREEREERGRPLTNAEAVRRHVALTNELGDIPAIADPARREACRIDDIDKLVAEPNLYKWDQARLLNLRDDIIASRIGARAKSELEDDRKKGAK